MDIAGIELGDLVVELGEIAAWGALAIVLLAVGYFVIDLLTPGRLGQLIYVEHNVNAAVVVASGVIAVGEVLPGAGSYRGHGDEDVQHRDDDDGGDDRPRQVPFRVPRLLAGRGRRVEADVREEQAGGGGRDPGRPHRREGLEGARAEGRERDGDEEDEQADLDQFPPGAPGSECETCMYWWADGITVELPALE